jgi:hypothetical protein
VKFTSKGQIGTEQPAQKVTPWLPRAALPTKGGSAAVKGGSAAPHWKGKATHTSYASDKFKRHVSPQEKKSQKPRDPVWGTSSKFKYQPKAQVFQQSLNSSFVLKNNSKGEVIAKYIGKDRNVYLHTSIWVPKVLVTNMKGPKNDWGPKPSN